MNGLSPLRDLSIIIPIAPGERLWLPLAGDLEQLPRVRQVLLAATAPPDESEAARLLDLRRYHPLHWLISAPGRAVQQNFGAAHATGAYLWFVHADSRLGPGSARRLVAACRASRRCLYFFDLRFLPDGPPAAKLNAYGAWFRSHLLGLPFGDQAFLLPRALFEELGGFMLTRGEDHRLVWAARRRGVSVQCIGTTIYSSARKYRVRGWLRTTVEHVSATLTQVLREIPHTAGNG